MTVILERDETVHGAAFLENGKPVHGSLAAYKDGELIGLFKLPLRESVTFDKGTMLVISPTD